jgi:hypothetical protein
MTAAEWLAAIACRGGTCRLDAQQRVCVRPSWALTPSLRAAFPGLQVTLVAVLKGRASTPARARPRATLEDVLALFPGARVVADGQPAVWPPAEIVQPTTDPLVLLARERGTPCVPLRAGPTIVGADWAWQHFARTGSPTDRAAARVYLEHAQTALVRLRDKEFPA